MKFVDIRRDGTYVLSGQHLDSDAFMDLRTEDLRIIFGTKLRQLRYAKNLSLKQLSEKSGLSISYISEIESGKKYPKPEKMIQVARGLGVTYDELVALQSAESANPALSFVRSPIFHEFPFKLFGIALTDVIDLLKHSPEKASALVRTLTEIGESYDMKVEQFFFAALRSYQKMHVNYFADLEDHALQFSRDHGLKTGPATYNQLARILTQRYGYTIDETTIAADRNLAHFRSVWFPGPPPRLLIHSHLSESQKAFVCGHALAYEYLKLPERPIASSWVKVDSFEQVLSNFRASYFAGVLLIPREFLVRDLEKFFASTRWQPDRLRNVMKRYRATPEMFFYRLTQLIPKFFGLEEIYFLRFSHERHGENFYVTKEFNFSRFFVPHGMGRFEHYCRRWLSIQLLRRIAELEKKGRHPDILVDAQRSHFINNDAEFLNLSMTRPLLLTENTNSCVTVGFLMTDEFKRKVKFWPDAKIPVVEVNETCERCGLTACKERAAPGLLFEAEQVKAQREKALDALMEKLGGGQY